MEFLSENHKKNFLAGYTRNDKRNYNRWLAAVFVLSSNDYVWQETCKHIVEYTKKDKVYWLNLKSNNPNIYTLTRFVKNILKEDGSFRLEELLMKNILDKKTFNLFMTAIRIARYGSSEVKI